MKNLTGALAFSLTLLLTTGCPKDTGESPDRVDPAAARPDASTPTTGNVQGAVPTQPSPPPSAPPPAEPTKDAQAAPEAVQSCVDRWLEARKLDRYGHPEGTMYAGGSPLFNESTGESRDRLDYIFERHPEAKKACAAAAQ